MSHPVESIADSEPTGRAGVAVGGAPLNPVAASRLLRVVVDNDVNLPGMFELVFLDLDGSTLGMAGLSIGSEVMVSGPGASGSGVPLIVGEVTAIEGLLQGLTARTVVRGYTGAHRLQRAKRSRSFLNVTDADVARRVASEAGLSVGQVVATSTTHAYLAQVNQTDWEFLVARATEIGFEMGVANGQFHFRPAGDSLTAAGGGMSGFGRSILADLAGGGSTVEVKFPDNLISFRPRITGGNLTPDVEVRVWDPMLRQTLAQVTNTPVGADPSPNALGRQFTGGASGAVTGSLESAVDSLTSFSVTGAANGVDGAIDAVGDEVAQATGGLIGSPVGFLGPPPSNTARVVVDRPFADGTTMATSGPMVAGALGSDVGSTFAEAEGEAKGNPGIQPGGQVSISGVPGIFAGAWHVSRARHIFDDSEFGYRVVFSAHGRQDRTMLGLTSKGAKRSAGNPVLEGVVCGVVSNCADPLGKGRVKVTLPWLSPDFETDWAPNVQFCSGQRSGAMFMPEIGDEVLVAFEFGDARRPYMLGAMMNNLTEWSIASGGPIFAGGLLGLGSAAAGMAGQMAGSALAGPMGGPLAGAVGGAIGDRVAGEIMDEATESIAGSALTPGMITEIHHRGFVSSTGNALLFYDVPAPLDAPSTAEAGQALGMDLDAGGGTDGGAGPIVPPGAGALGSAVRLGSQNGEIGVTVDQVNGGVNITADPVPGVTTMPLNNINISTMNGFINIGAGPSGTMLIDGGANLIIKSSTAITLNAPTVNIIGLPLVNGIPIPI
ncbi:phage baseplate assembly protein V [Actinokineospora pegani]|uniref:phage baseplate assembly protein V n=1 Tax=Actinokineospora pegani TaxID=2654637 RepID=UPI0012EAFD32|nr:phage baseplate assembly protein V [Actinokineospora pegani]